MPQNPFKSHRINPVALESVTFKGERSLSSPTPPRVLKRDVGIMTMDSTPNTRTIGICTNHVQHRSLGTYTDTKLYTKSELQAAIDLTIEKQLRDMETARATISKVSVGTQMAIILPQPPPPPPVPPICHSIQQQTEVIRVSDRSIQFAPALRSIGSCTDVIPVTPCPKCTITKRSVAAGPNESGLVSDDHMRISLQSLNMIMSTSSTNSLPPEKINVSSQTTPTMCHSRGSQHEEFRSPCKNRYTDTSGLIVLTNKSIGTMPPPICTSLGTQHDQPTPLMITRECNTSAVPIMRDQSCQGGVTVKSVECGADETMAKPLDENRHILISCSDNYCDSCKDTIKGLAKVFVSSRQISSAIGGAGGHVPTEFSRIPRPLTLASPRTERKFMRQNTYTLSGSSSTSSTPGVEERRLEFPVERYFFVTIFKIS